MTTETLECGDLSPLWTREFIPSPLHRKTVSIKQFPISAQKKSIGYQHSVFGR